MNIPNLTFTEEELQKHIQDGYVTKRKHHEFELYIYNYTPKAQFEYLWNEVTSTCRGLILNDKLEIIARPFRKFLNIEDHKELPTGEAGQFKTFTKLDGSLGILYQTPTGEYRISTRGSFDSLQARWATKLLQSKYSDIVPNLSPHLTYLFEILYPENRIVVDYHGKEDIVQIAVIDKYSGKDVYPIVPVGFEIVKQHLDKTNLEDITKIQPDNEEGYVLWFYNSIGRVKVKFEEYIRLHRIVTGLSTKSVWEFLKEGKDVKEILDRVPDEFFKFVTETEKELKSNFDRIKNEVMIIFSSIKTEGKTRKEIAREYTNYEWPALLFALLDNKQIDPTIWEMCKPKFERPFTNISEDM